MEIRHLTPEDAEQYFEHRREALEEEPLAFLSSPEDDLAASVDAVRELLDRGPESVIFGALVGDGLAGSLGIYREPKRKARHKAHMWGMYVSRAHRRQGTGRALLLAALDHAQERSGVIQVHLGVTDTSPHGASTRTWVFGDGVRSPGTSGTTVSTSTAITWS